LALFLWLSHKKDPDSVRLPPAWPDKDGLKIEGVSVVESGDGTAELYTGSDDENYGAVMRRILLRGLNPGGSGPNPPGSGG
jgi:hypothetical protein